MTEALRKFSELPGWQLIVVGDLKTPKSEYENLYNVRYLSPEYQEKHYKKLSDLIGWNCIQRRNIGFIEAYRAGADVVATVDDDNIPYPGWGENIMIGKKVAAHCYSNDNGFFEPLSVTNVSHLWHRGYPIEFVSSRKNNVYHGMVEITPDVQADLWDGEPDVDAVCRLIYGNPVVKIEGDFPVTSTSTAIFNSQNTFLSRRILPYYTVVAKADRMDDIWGGMILQKTTGAKVIFGKPSVYHKRNQHNIISDAEREFMGYRQTLKVFENPNSEIRRFYEVYQSYYRD
jgi:hypothetical protein